MFKLSVSCGVRKERSLQKLRVKCVTKQGGVRYSEAFKAAADGIGWRK